MDPPIRAALLRLATGHEAAQAVIVAARLGVADLLGDRRAMPPASPPPTGAPAPSLIAAAALAALDVVREEADGRSPSARSHTAADGVAARSGRWWCSSAMTGSAQLRRPGTAVRTGETAVRRLWGVQASFERCTANPRWATSSMRA